MEKLNLTIVDKNPDIKNFVYQGVVSKDVDAIKDAMSNGYKVIQFNYDEGFAMVSTSEVHSIVLSDYVPMNDSLVDEE